MHRKIFQRSLQSRRANRISLAHGAHELELNHDGRPGYTGFMTTWGQVDLLFLLTAPPRKEQWREETGFRRPRSPNTADSRSDLAASAFVR